MIIVIGVIIVFASVIGGFVMGGGHPAALVHVSEFVVIGGAALGAMIIMSPKKVLVDLVKLMVLSLKGAPHNRMTYEELLKSLYELFLLGRRNGMIALEEHVMNPEASGIFKKYPTFLKNHHAVQFLCGGLRPIIDGKIKPDQLKTLMDVEMETMESEHHAPISVMTKAADAMPGFGIVAAVLGIVITMAAISGPIEEIGHKVAAALVGTFLGIFISYGFMNPLAVNMEFICASEMAYTRCISAAIVSFANGMAPIMAIEVARRGLGSDVRPTADELEAMLKALNSQTKG
ncbi:MAG: chemotaxis protein MotA [Verrucomicrobiota bacterium]|jgi:chemotaxis protein MotA